MRSEKSLQGIAGQQDLATNGMVAVTSFLFFFGRRLSKDQDLVLIKGELLHRKRGEEEKEEEGKEEKEEKREKRKKRKKGKKRKEMEKNQISPCITKHPGLLSSRPGKMSRLSWSI